MAEIDIQYGVIFGKCDASDWIDWTVSVSNEEYAVYERDLLLLIDPNKDDRLSDCLTRAYDEIEDKEIENGISYGDEYVIECTGRGPVDPDEINGLVADRDKHTLEFFGLTGMSEEELDEWNANDLDELPDVCDFVEDFEPSSPFDNGWTLRVQFNELPDLTLENAKAALSLLFDEQDYQEVLAYIERADEYISWLDDIDLEDLADNVAKEKGLLEAYEKVKQSNQ